MSDITAERRMELIRTIREENSRNRMNLKNRESILYGHTYDRTVASESKEMTSVPQKSIPMTGFRILAAIILFSLFVILDYAGDTWLPVNTTIICEYIQENYIPNSFAFMDKITYTLTHE